MSDARSAPLYCPYCGEEDLRPNEASHGAWECHSCVRVFTVKFNGLLALPETSQGGRTSEKGVNR
jgi:transposase-like protein